MTLYFMTTFNEKLPVVIVDEKVIKDGRSVYKNVIVDHCPICGKEHQYLSDMFTFDRRECGGESFVTLKAKAAEYVIRLNPMFLQEPTK